MCKRDKIMFSGPVDMFKLAAKSIADVVAPRRVQQSPATCGIVEIADSESDCEIKDKLELRFEMEADGENLLPLCVTELKENPVVCQAPKEDTLFGNYPIPTVPLFAEKVFFTITAGSMSRHTVAGERPEHFDFLAQQYQVCWASDCEVQVIACGAPAALKLHLLSYRWFIDNLSIWRLGRESKGFVHKTKMCFVAINAIIYHSTKSFFRSLFLVYPAQPPQPCAPRSAKASSLLAEIIRFGAVEGCASGNYLCSNCEEDVLLELQQLRYVVFSSDHGDSVVATRAATSAIFLTQSFVWANSLLEYTSDPPPTEENMTIFDLLVALRAEGWVEKELSKKSKCDPYREGKDKVIYYHCSSALCKFYLRALWKSKDIFKKQILEIHYWQLESYYRALLECNVEQAKAIRPNQPMGYYRIVLGSTNSVASFANAGVGDTNSADAGTLAEIQDECILPDLASHFGVHFHVSGLNHTPSWIATLIATLFPGEMNLLPKPKPDKRGRGRGRARGRGRGRGRGRVQKPSAKVKEEIQDTGVLTIFL